MSVASVSTVRTPLNDLKKFGSFYLNTGTRTVFLFFDDPLDPTIEHFSSWKNVICIPCDHAYWAAQGQQKPNSIIDRQICNANAGLKMARDDGIDWIMHVDSDELVLTPGWDLDAFFDREGAS